MKPVVKGILIGCAVLFVLGVIGIIGVVYVVNTNKDQLLAKAQVVASEGEEFGKGSRSRDASMKRSRVISKTRGSPARYEAAYGSTDA